MPRALFLSVMLLLVNVASAAALPPCPSDTQVTWTNCEGTYTFEDGSTYAGGWRDDKKNGQGTYFFADGRVWRGLWRNDAWGSGKQYAAGQAPYEIYAARGVDAPPQVAERERREAEQEGLAAERERERLRQERIVAEKRAEARQQIEQERLAAERERERLQRERAQLAAEQERLRVERERLAAEQAVSEPELEPLDTAFVTVKNANVREQPDVQSSRVATLPIGSEITALAKVKDKNWYLVAREGEELGYVFGTLLADAESFAEEERLLAEKRAERKNRHAVAVIIGNRNYKGVNVNVDFAHNDADAMRQYVIEVLGYREGNIIDIRDATKAEIEDTFGTEKSFAGKLSDYVRAGQSDVTVFYSGHGVPGLDDMKGYLLPVDANPNRITLTGYPTDLLFSNLSKIDARSMTVYLDACFSGDSPKGMIIRAASGISVTPRLPSDTKQMVVITASQGDQYASWDEEAEFGLFTRYLLEGLRGAADGEGYGNGDDQVTLAEVKAYLDDEMTYQARRRYARRQNVSVQGDPDTVLVTHQH